MAAFIAKQMIGSKLDSVKGKLDSEISMLNVIVFLDVVVVLFLFKIRLFGW